MTASALLVSPQGRLRAGWRAALFVLLLMVFGMVATETAALIPTPATDPDRLRETAMLHAAVTMAIVYTAIAASALAATWIMVRFVDRTGWSYVGLGARDLAARPVTLSFVAGALAIGIPCVVLIAAGWLDVQSAPAAPLSPLADAGLALLILVPAALAEEAMMRGYLLSVLGEGIGRWGALLVTSSVFAMLHLRNPGMSAEALAVVALAGIFLGAIRYATSSLYAAWAAHLAWNFTLGVGFHALVSGTTIARSGWQTLDSGPDWATGGAWGPEGGLAAVLGLLAATSLLVIRRPRALAPAATNDTTNA